VIGVPFGGEPVLPETNETSVVTMVLLGGIVLAAVVGIVLLARLLVREWRRRG
jgi:LPXTG-motif cell wall-anchored protein